MRNRFDEQLSQLNDELVAMGAMCEEVIAVAVKYLLDNNEHHKEKIFEIDNQIDRKEREIESMCMRLLLQQQPVARDLRLVSAALKMISDMERIGDQASDIAEMVCFVNKDGIIGTVHIEDMARAVIEMVTDSVESFVKRDIELAYDAIAEDDNVDELFLKIKQELISEIKNDSSNPEGLLDLLMIAKYFERIGDHAENIAEWVIYSITGTHNAEKNSVC